MKISHFYLESLPLGNPSKLVELNAIILEEANAIILEEAEAEVEKTTDFVASMREIRQLIHTLMASGDIPQGSHI
jgi:hypothetical protein